MPQQDDDDDAPLRYRTGHDGTGRDFEFLDGDHVPLKVWLPESVEALLESWSTRLGVSKAGLVSQLLFAHLYGWCDLHAQFGEGVALATQRPRHAASRSPSYRPDLGKNVADVRTLVPVGMRDDLARLAAGAGLKLSAYARRVILDQFLGRIPVPMELPEPPFDEPA
jgi:hypothetical protein